jgi:F-type H+-transporting ATPase subunit alpha
MKAVAERLKIDYSRFMEVEVFTKFGAHVEEETAKLIKRGERLREILKQPRFHPFPLEEEVVSFLIPESGVLDAIDIASVEKVYKEILDQTKHTFPEIMKRIQQEGRLNKEDMEKLKDFITHSEGKN